MQWEGVLFAVGYGLIAVGATYAGMKAVLRMMRAESKRTAQQLHRKMIIDVECDDKATPVLERITEQAKQVREAMQGIEELDVAQMAVREVQSCEMGQEHMRHRCVAVVAQAELLSREDVIKELRGLPLDSWDMCKSHKAKGD